MDITDTVNSIELREDFISFIRLLKKDLKDNHDAWENPTLDRYLEALAACTEDMEGYYLNTKQDLPKNIIWKVFAEILIAAKMYE